MSLDDNFKDSLEDEKKKEELRRRFVEPASYVSCYSGIGSLVGVVSGIGLEVMNDKKYIDLSETIFANGITPIYLLITGLLTGCLVGYRVYRKKKGKEEKQ